MNTGKPVIAFVAGGINYNLYNRKSAIDSILCSILQRLNDSFEIYVNGEPLRLELKEVQSPIVSLSNSSSIAKYVPNSIKQILRDFKLERSHRKVLAKINAAPKPDIIFELMRYGSDIGLKLKKSSGAPLVAYFDAPAAEENRYLRETWSPFYHVVNKRETATIRYADRIIVYSEAIVGFWKKKVRGLVVDKFRVFQTLDYSRLKFADSKTFNEIPTIGFIGSFLKWHQVENLIRAFTIIRQDGLQARLLLIGAGEEYQAIGREVERSPFKKDIVLTGFIDGQKLVEFRNKIDIGVMPGTQWYCMPTKVFEYGASGIISIAPGTESIRTMFTAEELIFLRDSSTEELASKLKFVLSNFAQARIMSIALQKKIFRQNSLEKAIEFYNGLFAELLPTAKK